MNVYVHVCLSCAHTGVRHIRDYIRIYMYVYIYIYVCVCVCVCVYLVHIQVSDIYGKGFVKHLGLSEDLIASSFGKVAML